jgi:hypothetical protein
MTLRHEFHGLTRIKVPARKRGRRWDLPRRNVAEGRSCNAADSVGCLNTYLPGRVGKQVREKGEFVLCPRAEHGESAHGRDVGCGAAGSIGQGGNDKLWLQANPPEGYRGLALNFGTGILQTVDEGKNSRLCVGAKFGKRVNASEAKIAVLAFEAADECWNSEMWFCSDSGKGFGRHVRQVCLAEAANERRNGGSGSAGRRAHVSDGKENPVPASTEGRVLDGSNERRQSVCPDGRQHRGGEKRSGAEFGGSGGCVGKQTEEIWNEGRCLLPESHQCFGGVTRELFRAAVLDPVRNLPCWESAGKVYGRGAPGRAFALDPLQQARQRVGANCAYGLFGLVLFATSLVVDVVAKNPTAKGVPLVARFVDMRQKWEQAHQGCKADQHNQNLPTHSHGGSVA